MDAKSLLRTHDGMVCKTTQKRPEVVHFRVTDLLCLMG